MNDKPRHILREIIKKHGKIIIENPRRLENLLRDYCGEFRREISVLTMALEERAVADLLVSSALNLKVLLNRLAQNLSDNLALSETAARWSIYSWAWALDIISEAEFEAKEIEKVENFTPQIAVQTAQANQSSGARVENIKMAVSIFTVSATGGGNFKSINDALQNVVANSRLLIREGVYRESIVIDKPIELIGDGKIEKIIIQSTNQPCVSMQTNQATMRGLTLEGRGKSSGKAFFAVDIPHGALILENCRITSDSLSNVAIHGANANPILKNCRISDGADSGIYLFDNARATIENCDIYRNANENIAVTQGANPIVKNCRIFEGENGGIVVWGNGATATIEDCEIINHRLANVGIRQSANPVFRRCRISGGDDCGVFVQENGFGTFEECDVFGNLKAEVAITDKSRTTLRGCTIHQGKAAGIFVGNMAYSLIENCNIYNNRAAGISIYGNSSCAVRRSNIVRNGTVAVQIKEISRAKVEDCDLRENSIAAWETEHGISVERNNNRE